MESVVALFREPAQVKLALDALLDHGYARDNLGFTMLDVVAESNAIPETVTPDVHSPHGSEGGGLVCLHDVTPKQVKSRFESTTIRFVLLISL